MSEFENHKNYNCEITTDQGEKFLIYANWLHNQNLDQWQGWTCHAGYDRLYIDKNLDVWSGECCNDYLGHAIDGVKELAIGICKKKTCTGCTDDLATYKESPKDV